MAAEEHGPLTPLAIVAQPDKPIAEMTDAERAAFAERLYDAIAAGVVASSDVPDVRPGAERVDHIDRKPPDPFFDLLPLDAFTEDDEPV